MRIAINGWFLQEPGTGTGQYTRHLIRAIGRVDGVNDYHVVTPHDVADALETPSTFTFEQVPLGALRRSGANVAKLFWEQHTFPAAAKRAHARLMHVPHFAPPLRTLGIPVVVTIHDVIGLRLPAYRASPSAAAYGRLVARAARNAALVIADSEFTKRDIMELIGLPAERIRVVLLAPAPEFRRVLDAQRLRDARERYGLGERFVLCTAGLDARKNIATLVAAFAAVYHEIGDPDLQLFVSGNPERLGSSPLFPDWRPLAQTMGVADQITCAYIAEQDQPLLYSAASCFVYPSLYEGFGLPPLEAMACGAPVVCSERTSLPEVVGSAGILVNPDDADALGVAMQRVLESTELREDLRARGLARVKQFGWDQVAVDTIAVYTEVAEARE